MIYLIILLFLCVILFGFIFSLLLDKGQLLKTFRDGNVIVYGRKGKGKDCLFQYVINKRKKPYCANMTYGGKGSVLPLTLLIPGSNDFNSVINDNVVKFPAQVENKKDWYISDGGIYFPSQYTHELNKLYKGLPLTAALSRQLYQMNIHINTQAITRVWKVLREQTDSYVWIQRRKIGFIFMRIDWVIYYRESDAIEERLPMKERRGLFQRKDPQIEQYNHMIGNPYLGRTYLRKKAIKFDTYFFRKVFIDEPVEEVKYSVLYRIFRRLKKNTSDE